MDNKNILSIDELLDMNSMMLGRGMPVQNDGVGYNKADYGACANYYYGLSNAQIYDLAKRLVKYSETQLGISKDTMRETAKYYRTKVENDSNRVNGISIDISDNWTKVGFRYNEDFIRVMRSQPRHKSQYDGDSRQWSVSNDIVIDTLNKLKLVGADVDNALDYANNHSLIKGAKAEKTDVFIVFNEDRICVKFNYNEDIINEIRKIDKSERTYNPKHKYWIIAESQIKPLMRSLRDMANFKMIGQD